jgi:ATP-binding cassette subfamily B protein
MQEDRVAPRDLSQLSAIKLVSLIQAAINRKRPETRVMTIMMTLRRLAPYLRQHAWAFWGGMIGLLAARLFEAAIPYFLKQGIDALADASRNDHSNEVLTNLIGPIALSIALCVVAQIVVTIISRILIRRIGVYVAFDLRNRLYAHLQRQGPNFYGDFPVGDLMARAINDITRVRELVAGTSRTTMVLVFTAIVGLLFMLSLSWQLTLAVIIPAPLITYFAHRYAQRIFIRSQRTQEGFAELSTFVQQNLNGIRTVQAMAQERREIERFAVTNQTFADDNIALFRDSSAIGAIMPVIAGCSTLIILGYGSFLYQAGEISIGTFTAFFSYLALLLWPIREAGTIVTQWQRGASGTARVFEILDFEPEIPDQGSPNHPELTGSIHVKNLSYRYLNKNKDALTQLSFRVEAGQTLAIVGRVGSGKSTLLRLLVRLLEPTTGSILLDQRPIQDYPLSYLREKVCLVLQDPFLFADSLGDNIAYDNPERSPGEILDSASVAALSSTIDAFPEGLNTILGERGITLSGGQKQRAALARGIIRMSPLLVLDDCFSAVDTETEEHILSGLKNLRQGLTTLIVSNRVSTARHADQILVLDEGRLIEMGDHQTLLAKGGFYYDLEQKQRLKGHDLEQ